MGYIVGLEEEEAKEATAETWKRVVRALRKGSKDSGGKEPDFRSCWICHHWGCICERAVFKLKGLPWLSTEGQYQDGFDVGTVNVRGVQKVDKPLYLRKGDSAAKRHVLVRPFASDPWPVLWVVGSAMGHVIRQHGFDTDLGDPRRPKVRAISDDYLEQIYD